jgi:hypothetical protein
MARPRGGDWLTDEVQAWQDACVDVIVSLLMREEQQELELLDEAPLCHMMAAATLVALGETPERAFAMIQEARGCEVPDTPEQLQWVKRFSAGIQTSDQK